MFDPFEHGEHQIRKRKWGHSRREKLRYKRSSISHPNRIKIRSDTSRQIECPQFEEYQCPAYVYSPAHSFALLLSPFETVPTLSPRLAIKMAGGYFPPHNKNPNLSTKPCRKYEGCKTNKCWISCMKEFEIINTNTRIASPCST